MFILHFHQQWANETFFGPLSLDPERLMSAASTDVQYMYSCPVVGKVPTLLKEPLPLKRQYPSLFLLLMNFRLTCISLARRQSIQCIGLTGVVMCDALSFAFVEGDLMSRCV